MDLFNHRLRLHADPSRVVVRPFHIAWGGGNGAPPSRTERLVGEVLAMSPQEARDQLETVLKDFEARHWQTRRVFMTRYDQIEDLLKLDGSKISDEASADRRLFLPRIQLCRGRADESVGGAAFRPDRHPAGVATYPDVDARGG